METPELNFAWELGKDGLESVGTYKSFLESDAEPWSRTYSNLTKMDYTNIYVRYVYPNGDYDLLTITGELWSYTAETKELVQIIPKADYSTKTRIFTSSIGSINEVVFYYQELEIRAIILKNDGTRIELYRDGRRKKIYQDGGWMWI